MPEQTVRIAMGQIVCLDGDRRGNLARIEQATALARQADARLRQGHSAGQVGVDVGTR